VSVHAVEKNERIRGLSKDIVLKAANRREKLKIS